MNLTTKRFAYSKLLHFKLTVLLFLRRRWKVFAIFLVSALTILMFGQILLAINLLTISILWALVVLMLSWIKINSRQNFKYYQSRYIKINNQILHLYLEGNQHYKTDLTTVSAVIEESDYLLLLLPKNSFIYIPFNALQQPTDKTQLLNIKPIPLKK